MKRCWGLLFSIREGENGQGCLRLLPADQIPSIYQFQYWYRKNRDEKTEAKKRGGDAKFELTRTGNHKQIRLSIDEAGRKVSD